jgi:transposase-like protein
MKLKFMSEPPLDARLLSCADCGEEKHIWIDSQQERRLRCGTCGRTFTESCGTPLYGLQYPQWLVLVVVSLLAHGCPVQAIVFAFMLDERTVVDWQTRVGRHAKRVQAELVCQDNLEVGQVQGDELYVKTQQGPVWIATAMCVFSHLFIWGEVSAERKTALIERVVVRVRAAPRRGASIQWVTDGFGGWIDAVRRLRLPVRTGKRRRSRLQLWADLSLVQVIKHRAGQRLGAWAAAQEIMCCSQTQLGGFNTAYVERLNACWRNSPHVQSCYACRRSRNN